MKRLILVALIFLLYGITNNVSASFYQVLYEPDITWHKAKDNCRVRGGHLATISSKEEDDLLTALLEEAYANNPFPSNAPWWGGFIGLTDENQEGVWEWITGEPLVYTNWDPGEPVGNYDYAAKWMCCFNNWLNVLGAWNDVPEGISYHFYICEYDWCPIKNIYGEQSAETDLLRDYRDNVLNKTPEGQELIRLYYLWSPVIVQAMEADEEFKREIKELIDDILPMIEQGGQQPIQ
jgi:hypothetical protein